MGNVVQADKAKIMKQLSSLRRERPVRPSLVVVEKPSNEEDLSDEEVSELAMLILM
jgi:hypothetical protein